MLLYLVFLLFSLRNYSSEFSDYCFPVLKICVYLHANIHTSTCKHTHTCLCISLTFHLSHFKTIKLSVKSMLSFATNFFSLNVSHIYLFLYNYNLFILNVYNIPLYDVTINYSVDGHLVFILPNSICFCYY